MVAFSVNTVQRKILLVEIPMLVNKLSYLATVLEGRLLKDVRYKPAISVFHLSGYTGSFWALMKKSGAGDTTFWCSYCTFKVSKMWLIIIAGVVCFFQHVAWKHSGHRAMHYLHGVNMSASGMAESQIKSLLIFKYWTLNNNVMSHLRTLESGKSAVAQCVWLISMTSPPTSEWWRNQNQESRKL